MRRRLNDAEVLLWQLGQHPLLGSTMGAVVETDRPADPETTLRVVRHAVANIAGLRERVDAPAVPLSSPPCWTPDPDLDLDHHVRFVRLEANSPRRELHRLAAQILADPFDTSRPLWQLTVVGGLRHGRGAVVAKVHHAIADGQGALSLAAHLFGFAADQPLPPEVDLGPLLRSEVEAADAVAGNGRFGGGLLRNLDPRSFDARRLQRLNDAAGFVIDPRHLTGAGAGVLQAARQLTDTDGDQRQGSPLWHRRSRNRRLHALEVPLDDLRRAARRRGATINDLFLALTAGAVVDHHARRGVDLESVSTSVVISRRTEHDGAEDNAVVPVPLTIPGVGADLGQRLAAIERRVRHKAEAARGQVDLVGLAGGLVGYVPASLTAAVALGQTSRIDVATSNVPGPPGPVWFAGSRVRAFLPVGPLMGTAVNLTLLSYDGVAGVGVSIDPAAVEDHVGFTAELARSFQSELGGPVPRS